MTLKRICYIAAAALFALAWLVSLGTITADSDFFTWQALVALGLATGYVGHAL